MNALNESLLLFTDKSNHLHIIEPSALPYSDKEPTLSLLVKNLIQTGYKGILVETYELSSGVKFQSIQFDLRTPEGRLISVLSRESTVPPLKKALRCLELEYSYISRCNKIKPRTDRAELG